MDHKWKGFSGWIWADFPKSLLGINHPPEWLWEIKIPQSVRKIIAAAVFSLVSCVPNDSFSQGDSSCKLWQQSLATHPVRDINGNPTDAQYAFLRCFPDIKIKIYLPDAVEMEEYWYSYEEYRRYMEVIEDVWFQEFVFPLFQDVFEETGINMWGIDFIPFIDLYLARKNKDAIGYDNQIHRIITGYSALPFEKIFVQRGLKSI